MQSPFHSAKSDGLSFCVTPVELLFQGERFSHGTGFLWKQQELFYLVINWYNLAGKNPFGGENLNAQGRIPDSIRIAPCTSATVDERLEIRRNYINLSLYEHFDKP